MRTLMSACFITALGDKLQVHAAHSAFEQAVAIDPIVAFRSS